MNKHVTYISYKDAGITIVEDNKDEVKYKTNIKGNYCWRTSLDRETGVMTIHFEPVSYTHLDVYKRQIIRNGKLLLRKSI